MGMYDYLICEIDLPDGFSARHRFQTKDFECLLDLYTITKEGKLELIELDYSSESVKVEATRAIDYIDGTITFTNLQNGYWREYKATFKAGSLVSIKKSRERYIGE